MIALLEEHNIAFVGSPKSMTTSMLHLFHDIQHGRPFDRAAAGGVIIHDIYKKRAEELGMVGDPAPMDKLAGYWTFTIVRDPVSRLMSGYSNRVMGLDELTKVMARPLWQAQFGDRAKGLDPRPDADTFFRNIDLYRELFGTIRHHTQPMRDFIGADLSAFDKVYPIEKLSEVEAEIGRRVGKPVQMPSRQRSGKSARFTDLSPEAQEALLALAMPDYELLFDWYQPPQVTGSAPANQAPKA